MTKQISVQCLFCDDVRHEVGGKMSIMGVYGSDMIFPTPPPVQAKLAIFVLLSAPVGELPKSFTVHICGTGDEETVINFNDMDPVSLRSDSTMGQYRVVATSYLLITKPKKISVEVGVGDHRIKAGGLRIGFPDAAAPAVSAGKV
jgi:hypothetical protein